jgi:hypothetical protein
MVGSVGAEGRSRRGLAASHLAPAPCRGLFVRVPVRIKRGAVEIEPVGTAVGAIAAVPCTETAAGRRELPAPRPGRNGVLFSTFRPSWHQCE